MTNKTKVSFIGTDTMGRPMIFKLLEKGYTLKVHEKYKQKETVVALGSIGEDFPKPVTRDCHLLIACLPLLQEILENMSGKNGSIEGINKGATCRNFNNGIP